MKEIYCPRVVTSLVLCFLQKLTAPVVQHFLPLLCGTSSAWLCEQSTLFQLPGAFGAILGCPPHWVLNSLTAVRTVNPAFRCSSLFFLYFSVCSFLFLDVLIFHPTPLK